MHFQTDRSISGLGIVHSFRRAREARKRQTHLQPQLRVSCTFQSAPSDSAFAPKKYQSHNPTPAKVTNATFKCRHSRDTPVFAGEKAPRMRAFALSLYIYNRAIDSPNPNVAMAFFRGRGRNSSYAWAATYGSLLESGGRIFSRVIKEPSEIPGHGHYNAPEEKRSQRYRNLHTRPGMRARILMHRKAQRIRNNSSRRVWIAIRKRAREITKRLSIMMISGYVAYV